MGHFNDLTRVNTEYNAELNRPKAYDSLAEVAEVAALRDALDSLVEPLVRIAPIPGKHESVK